MAISTSGSYRTTVASYFLSPTSTVGFSTPATTCAFVITRWGAYTKPEPSRPREHEATPVILAILLYAACTAGSRPVVLSGGRTGRIRSGTNGSRNRGNRSVLTTSLNACSARSAPAGMIWSTLASTFEPRTADVTDGIRAPLTATPSTHATTSTETAARTPPPSASIARTGRQLIWLRSFVPRNAPRVRPPAARTMTSTSATNDTVTLGLKLPSSTGTP